MSIKNTYGREWHTALAHIADDLVRNFDEKEDRRIAERELLEDAKSTGPILDSLQRAIASAQHETLTNSKLPAVMTFDAYCIVKDASKSVPEDRGLKLCAHTLYDLWNRDPMGSLSVGDLTELRDFYADTHPKSAAKKVLDTKVPEVGFQTLTNQHFLAVVASQVVDQDSYENAIEMAGLDGDRPEHIRARAFIKSLAELALSDDAFETNPGDTGSIEQRVLNRLAQEEMDEDMDGAPGPSEDYEDLSLDDAGGDSEDLVEDFGDENEDSLEDPMRPHDESSEEMATIESPVTGEPLVIELGMESDQSVEGFEPDMDESPMASGGALPMGFENQAQMDMEMEPEPELDMGDEPGMGEEMDGPMEPEMESSDETFTTIIDPSSGEELELTLRHVETSNEEESQGITLDTDMEPSEDDVVPEDMDMFSVEPAEMENEMKMASIKSQEAKALSPAISPQPEDKVSVSPKTLSEKSDPTKGGSKTKKGTLTKLSKTDVEKICEGLGITASVIEENLLNGNVAEIDEFSLKIAANDAVELSREDKIVRSGSLNDLDAIISDFMAITAAKEYKKVASSEAKTTSVRSTVPSKTATQNKVADYYLTSDVPGKAPINAKRIMSAVWKVEASAEGEMLDDGRLAIRLKASERELNRIRKVLADVFGVKNIEAQMVSNLYTDPNSKSGISAEPQNGDSPYNGATPTQRTPAGQPAKPMTAPQQTAVTGSQEQADFIKRNTDPLKTAQMGMGGQEMDMAGPGDMDPGMGDMGGGMDMDPGMGGMGMGSEAPAASTQDASQIPLDIGSGSLQPEDEEAARAAMSHFRNTGLMPLEAMSKFVSSYGAMLEKYGDEKSPERAKAEAGIVKLMSEAFSKPAVIPLKSATLTLGSTHKANMPTPRVNVQQPSKVSVTPSQQNSTDMKTPGVNMSPNVPSGKMTPTNMGESGPDAGFKEPAVGGPQTGSQKKNKGVKYTPTDMSVGTNGDSPESKKLDSVSKAAPNSFNSTKKGEAEFTAERDFVVSLEENSGRFLLTRASKKLARYDELGDALADAERRSLGTTSRIFTAYLDGEMEEVERAV